MNSKPWILAAALSFSLVVPSPARAELFAALYAGGAFAQDGDVTVRTEALGLVGTADYSGSFTAGGRVGYWFGQGAPVGLALDVSYFRPSEELHVAPVSLLLFVRLPQPQEGWRPELYAGAGPGLFVSVLDIDLDPPVNQRYADVSADLGLDVRAGLAWKVSQVLAMFIEYRFTHVEPEFDDTVRGARVTTAGTLNTHSVLLGFRF